MSATQARVGELVCLQESDSQQINTWGIGVIRWMKSPIIDGLELGVQMLAPNAVPVAAKTSRDGKTYTAYQRCLLLPEIAAIQQPARRCDQPDRPPGRGRPSSPWKRIAVCPPNPECLRLRPFRPAVG